MARREKKIEKRFKSGKELCMKIVISLLLIMREGVRVIGVRCPNGESG